MKVKVDEGAFWPTRAHPTDAGLDICTPVGFMIYPGETKLIDTGIHIQLPAGTVGLIKTKSGINARGITTEGVIDEGYTGSIKVLVRCHSVYIRPSTETSRNLEMVAIDWYRPPDIFERTFVRTFERGDKIAQLLVVPVRYEDVVLVDELEDSERGNNGFGSTGR